MFLLLQVLDPDECMYAVSQGALAVECRSDDEETLRILQTLNDEHTVMTCIAERAFLKRLVNEHLWHLKENVQFQGQLHACHLQSVVQCHNFCSMITTEIFERFLLQCFSCLVTSTKWCSITLQNLLFFSGRWLQRSCGLQYCVQKWQCECCFNLLTMREEKGTQSFRDS